MGKLSRSGPPHSCAGLLIEDVDGEYFCPVDGKHYFKSVAEQMLAAEAAAKNPHLTLPVWEDAVEHPSHYTSGKVEVWDFIIDQKLSYAAGNAIKYISRAGKKDPSKHVEDLDKAIAFLQREKRRVIEDEQHVPVQAGEVSGNQFTSPPGSLSDIGRGFDSGVRFDGELPRRRDPRV